MAIIDLAEPDNQGSIVTAEQREWAEAGSSAFVENSLPVINKAAESGDPANILNVYAGLLGAWWGALVAEVGLEAATSIALTMFDGVLRVRPTYEDVQTH
jgi:hypothetical protein